MELRTYTGDSVKPTGFCNVTVQNRGHSKLPIYVIKNEGPTLLGREWLESIQLDWPLLQLETSDTIPTLEDVLSKHSNVFSEGLGKMKNNQALIQLQKICSASILESFKPAVNDALRGLEAEEVIEKVATNEWAAPIMTPMRKDGIVRVCGDFMVTIKPQLEIDEFLVPRADDIYASLSRGTLFSVLDLRHAYQQLEVEERSRPSLTINTTHGLYQYQRLPYAVASAPTIRLRAMNQVLQGTLRVSCYLDDIIEAGRIMEEYLERLAAVLKRLEEYDLRANQERSNFLRSSVEYLARVISTDLEGLH